LAAIGHHHDLLTVQLDVTRAEDAEAAVAAAIAKFGRIDVLVNNAGNFYAGFFEELTPEQVRHQIESLLFGPMNVSRAVLPVRPILCSFKRTPTGSCHPLSLTWSGSRPPLPIRRHARIQRHCYSSRHRLADGLESTPQIMTDVTLRVGIVRGVFAISAASLAILSLTYGYFAPSQQSLAGWIPQREIWVHLSALLLLTASVGLCFSRTVLPSALTIVAYEAVWAALGTPPILSKPLSIGAWYGFCEALTAFVGAWIIYAMMRWQPQMPIAGERAVRVAQVVFGLTCVFYGVSHFAYADYTAGMVPPWLPGRRGLAYFTGLGHVSAGIGIIAGILPRLAANLEAIMMSLFGLLVWVPSFLMQPRPEWATPPQNQWSELVVTLVLVASACIVATSFGNRPWGFVSRVNEQ
jgi:uncharacterized membrane protein